MSLQGLERRNLERFGKKKPAEISRLVRVSEGHLGKAGIMSDVLGPCLSNPVARLLVMKTISPVLRTLAMRNFSLVSNLSLPCCTWADFALPTKDMKCSRIWTLVSYLLPQSPSCLWDERSHFIPSFIEINTVKSSDHPHEWSQISSPLAVNVSEHSTQNKAQYPS